MIFKLKKLQYLKIEAVISLFAGLKALNILLQFVVVLKIEKKHDFKIKGQNCISIDPVVYIKESIRGCDGLVVLYRKIVNYLFITHVFIYN